MEKTTKRQKTAKRRALEGKVINMVVEGKTYKEISQHTGLKSPKSIWKIKKSNAEVIAKKKEAYIKLIDSRIGDEKQAEKLGELLNATVPVYNRKGEYMGDKPDSRVQLDTIKYIDELKGRKQTVQQLTQNNLIISKDLDKYTG